MRRRDEPAVVRRQPAGHRGEHCRHDEDQQLVACTVDAGDLRGDFGGVHRAKRAADRRIDQVGGDPHRSQQASTRQPVPCPFTLNHDAKQRQRRHLHAVRTAGEAVFGCDHDRHDDAQAQRRHREVVALESQDRTADHEGNQRDTRRRRDQRRERRPAVARGEQRRAVRAQAEEAGVPEADLPGVADEQVEADADDGVQRDQDRNVVEVVVGDHQRQQRDDEREQREAAGARRAPPGGDRVDRA